MALSHRLELMYTICVGGKENFWQPHSDIFLKPNRWYMIVANYDASLQRVSLWAATEEGPRISSPEAMRQQFEGAPIIEPSCNPVRLGWTGSADEYLNGELRNVRIVDDVAETIAGLKKKGVDHPLLAASTYVPHQFVAADGALSGIVRVEAINPTGTPAPVTLLVKIGQKTLQQTAEAPAAGAVGLSVVVPESAEPQQAEIALVQGENPVGGETLAIPGSKEISAYRGLVVSHTHSDLCWCDTPEVCLTANVEAFAKSVELAETVPGYRFTMEHALYVREYLHRHPDKRKTVQRLLKAGVIETGAFYTGPWELTSGAEGLVRQLYLGKRWLQKNLGVEPVIVWNVDIAGHTAQMPQILHKAGVRAWSSPAGAVDDTFQRPYLLHTTRGPFLFRWQAPDGSTVMTWSTPWGYSAGQALGMRNDTLDAAASTLPTFLDDIRRNCTAHNLPPVAFITDGTDVEKPSAQVGKNIAKWNAEKRFPPLTYVSSRELFRAVEKATLPTYAGEMPSYWDILQSLGNECLMADRRLDGRLLAAEKFAALASRISPDFAYPHEKLEQVWEDRLYVVEHNWGGTNGEISDRVKTEKTRQAWAINDTVLDSAFRSLAGAIGFRRQNGVRVVVFNPLSWDRKDIVTCTLAVAEAQRAEFAFSIVRADRCPARLSGVPLLAGPAVPRARLDKPTVAPRRRSPFARTSRRWVMRPITRLPKGRRSRRLRPLMPTPKKIASRTTSIASRSIPAAAASRAFSISGAGRNSFARTATTPATNWSPVKTTRWTTSATSPASNG